jgi:tRNA G18 (ribose-2'-O)-methylase SpoU
MIRSLNVSIAASIVLYEYLKQWRQSHSLVALS